ncbi:MAG: hypothetical protein HQL27_09215 [Candidatus Omnitrophica bacterium]|nr:hypothetical protein [Candidatus Omnitrophota bacterium]
MKKINKPGFGHKQKLRTPQKRGKLLTINRRKKTKKRFLEKEIRYKKNDLKRRVSSLGAIRNNLKDKVRHQAEELKFKNGQLREEVNKQ